MLISGQAADFPDPFVFRAQGSSLWYAYATGAGFVDLQMAVSSDLATWSWAGVDPLPGGTNGWADLFANSWAPSVIQRGSTFVMYYTAHSRAANAQCIGRATSSSPAGPFSDERSSALICQSGGGSIDPSPYVAPDGSLWLLFSSNSQPTSIYSVRLTSDGLSTSGGFNKLLTTAAAWEGPLIEAPTMITSPSGEIQLYYSANPYDTSSYSVGVARCTSPTGPCTRIYTTALLATRSSMAGPGGQTPFQDAAGNWQVAFHSWTSPNVGYPSGGKRTLRFLPMTFPSNLPKIG
jgi:beta-xylosidase